jgi:hypothetical protein
MGQQLWINPLVTALGDGPTLLAAAAASCLPTAARCTLPPGAPFWYPGKQLRLTASGRISCAAGAAGTARFDVRFGSTIVFDSQPINLNLAGKTGVGWLLELLLSCRTVGGGNAATLFGQGKWTSEAGVGAAAATAGGNAVFLLPYNAAPAVGAGFDSTAAQLVDLFYTQTVASGSLTLHQYLLEEIG